MTEAVGKHVAGMDAFSPKWSLAAACFLSPCGPSERNRLLIPRFGKSFVDQKSLPVSISAFSSSVICEIIFSLSILQPLFAHSGDAAVLRGAA